MSEATVVIDDLSQAKTRRIYDYNLETPFVCSSQPLHALLLPHAILPSALAFTAEDIAALIV